MRAIFPSIKYCVGTKGTIPLFFSAWQSPGQMQCAQTINTNRRSTLLPRTAGSNLQQNGMQATKPSSPSSSSFLSSSSSSSSSITASPSLSPYAINSTVQRINAKTMDGSKKLSPSSGTFGNLDPEHLTLMEKWRNHYNGVSNRSKSKMAARVWFQFQALTQLYMCLVHLLPHILVDYSDMTLYYFKILFCYVCIMSEANWLCAICYPSAMPNSRDRPQLDSNDWFENPPQTFEEIRRIKENHNQMDTTDKNGLEWKYCEECERFRPPRAHHCQLCQVCILRRDHHCYLIGTCIGHYNQRYFIVLCFLATAACVVSFPLTVTYLLTLPGATWWAHYVLPYTCVRFFTGQVSWQFLLLTYHAYMELGFGVFGAMYGLSQISIVSMGTTRYEMAKSVNIKVTTSTSDNMRLVFGDYWLINFLFPAQIIFKQRHDGMHYEGLKIFPKSGGDRK